MKLSVMTYSFSNALGDGTMSHDDVVRFLRDELDIDALEIMHAHVKEQGIDHLRQVLDECGSHVACYIGGGDFVHRTPEARQPAVDAVKEATDWCAALGCQLMLVTTGGVKEDIDQAEARKLIAEGLKPCVEYAGERGVTMTIEDVGSIAAPYGVSDDLLEMCERVGPDLKLTYDNGNFYTRGEDPLTALDRIWDKTVHVHLKDWRRVGEEENLSRCCVGAGGVKYVGVPCGEGLLDYPAIIGELKRRGYAGCMSFEYEGLDDPREAARKGVANIRALL